VHVHVGFKRSLVYNTHTYWAPRAHYLKDDAIFFCCCWLLFVTTLIKVVFVCVCACFDHSDRQTQNTSATSPYVLLLQSIEKWLLGGGLLCLRLLVLFQLQSLHSVRA
jgi:hypothetical protein